VDAHGIITATGSITGADLTSGEIGGSTSVNTSGDLATTGDIGAGGDITAGGNVSAGSVSTGSLSTSGGITSAGDVSVTGVGGKVSATNGEFRRLHLLDDQATPHYVEVRSPDPLTANYTLTLPGSLGSANQILGMNNAGNALENKTLTAGTGVTITHSAGGIEITASGSGGTVTSVTGTAPIVVDNSNPNTPIVTLDDSGVGVGTYGSATEVPVITVDVKGRITSASNTTISGVSPAGSNLATGKAWIGDGTGKATEAYINVSDLKKSDGTPQIPSTCTASQTMTWSSVTDVFTCSNITVTKSQISDFPTLGTAALEDVGTNAGDVVQLDPSGKLPAVDGSQLTNLTLPSYDTTYFKQGGNSFGSPAVLGTNDTQPINFAIDGTAQMTILTNGNVGLGTTAPTRNLEVRKSQNAMTSIKVENPNSGTSATSALSLNADGTNASLYATSTGNTSTINGISVANSLVLRTADATPASALFIGHGGSAPIYLFNNDTVRMTVSSSGNVGIGTTNPGALLQVGSGPNNIHGIQLGNNTSMGVSYSDNNLVLGRNVKVDTTNNVQGQMLVMNTANGGAAAIKIGSDLAGTANDGIQFHIIGSGVTGGDVFSSEVMRINYNGKVGIGTTSPLVSLDLGNKTDAVRLPAGTTAEQPSSPVNGMIRYNSSNNKFEAYENGAWTNMIGGSASSASSVSAGAGSVGTPSISFSGDPDTGFYSSGTNSIGISAGGANIFNLTSNGLTSPTAGGALLKTGNGTAAAPTFSFAGDTDTGWYLAAPDTLAASTGGVERMRIDSSGKIGIGTAAPMVDTTPAALKIMRPDTTWGLAIENSAGSFQTDAVFNTTTNNTDMKKLQLVNVLNSFQLRTIKDDDSAISKNLMSIDFATGNVGIGTTGPSVNMEVSGTDGNAILRVTNRSTSGANQSPQLQVTNYAGTQNYPGGINFLQYRGTLGTPNAVSQWDGLGYIGAMGGTGNGWDLNNASYISFFATETFDATHGGAAIDFATTPNNTTTPVVHMRLDQNGGVALGDYATTQSPPSKGMILSGNLGIGTTGPAAKLHVKNDTQVPAIFERNQSGTQSALLIYQPNTTDGNSLDISMRSDTTGTGAQTNVDFGAIRGIAAVHNHATRAGQWAFTTANGGAPTEKMRITANGNVGIGTNDPGQKLHVQGTDGVVGILVENTDSTAARWPSVTVRNYQGSPANTGFPAYHLEASRGSKASPLPVAQGDHLGSLQFWGARDVAGTKIRGAFINAIAKENFTSSTGATDMTFATNPTGSTDASTHEQMRITSEGNVGIGTTNPQAKLEVAGSAVIGTGRGAKTIGVVSFFTPTSDSASYIHIKTPFRPAVNNGMYHFKVEGYAYDDSKDVDLTFVGYSYTVTPTVIVNPSSRDPSGIYNPTQYIGSDGYIYLRFKPSNLYYLSFRVDSMYVGNGRIIYPGEMSVIVSTSANL